MDHRADSVGHDESKVAVVHCSNIDSTIMIIDLISVCNFSRISTLSMITSSIIRLKLQDLDISPDIQQRANVTASETEAP